LVLIAQTYQDARSTTH